MNRVVGVFKPRPKDNPNVIFLKQEIMETIRFFHDLVRIPDIMADLGLDGDTKKHLTRCRIFKALFRAPRMQEALALAKPMSKAIFVAPHKPAAAEPSSIGSNKRQRSE